MAARNNMLLATLGLVAGCSTGPDLATLAEKARPRITARAPVVVFLPGTGHARMVSDPAVFTQVLDAIASE